MTGGEPVAFGRGGYGSKQTQPLIPGGFSGVVPLSSGLSTWIAESAASKANLAELDVSGAFFICLCCMDKKNPIRIHDAARRLRSHAPHANLFLGIWSANDGTALSGLKDAINADYAVRSFRQALAIVLEAVTEQNSGEDDYANKTSSLIVVK